MGKLRVVRRLLADGIARLVAATEAFGYVARNTEVHRMIKEKIDRINFLAHKSKTPEGLTNEEKAEQFRLREEYIKEWREGVLQTLDNTYIVDENGKETKLKPKE